MATKIKIYVRTRRGNTIDLKVDPDEPVVNLKELINKTEDIPTNQMELIYAGKLLSDLQGC